MNKERVGMKTITYGSPSLGPLWFIPKRKVIMLSVALLLCLNTNQIIQMYNFFFQFYLKLQKEKGIFQLLVPSTNGCTPEAGQA